MTVGATAGGAGADGASAAPREDADLAELPSPEVMYGLGLATPSQTDIAVFGR